MVRRAKGRLAISIALSGSFPATEWILVVSSASCNERGGNIVGNLFASMVLPAPGGPTRMALWPPAAAISNARFMFSWPFTSAKSKSKWCWVVKNSSWVLTVTGCKDCSSLKNWITSLMWLTPYTSRLLTMAASLEFCLAICRPLNPSFRVVIAMGKAPLMG